jgi:hypothetical protein
MAGTTGLEPATSAVTVSQKPVTYWNQEARMATQSTLRNPWKPLLHPQPTQVLCPRNLCPTISHSTFAAVRQRTWVRKRRNIPPEAIRFVRRLPERLLPKSVTSGSRLIQIAPRPLPCCRVRMLPKLLMGSTLYACKLATLFACIGAA